MCLFYRAPLVRISHYGGEPHWRLSHTTGSQPATTRLILENIHPCPQKPFKVKGYLGGLAPLRSSLMIGGWSWPKPDQFQDPYPQERTYFSASSKAICITKIFSNSVDWLKSFLKYSRF